MAFENKSHQELRKLFEALLQDALKSIARKQLADGEKAIPEIHPTFRAGFRWALTAFGIVQDSTTELNDEQLRMLCERMHELLNLPPLPDSPDSYAHFSQ